MTGPVQPETLTGTLWTQARRMIQEAPAGQRGLTEAQLQSLCAVAVANGVTVEEEQLMLLLADPANVEALEAALEAGTLMPEDQATWTGRARSLVETPFDLNSLSFAAPESLAMRARLRRADWSQTVSASRSSNVDIPTERRAAPSLPVGPGERKNLGTAEGRRAVLQDLSQYASEFATGPQACGATALIACAVAAGPQAVAELARIAEAGIGGEPTLQRLAAAAENGQPFTMADLMVLQDCLFIAVGAIGTTRMVAGGMTCDDANAVTERLGLHIRDIQCFMQDQPRFARLVQGQHIVGIDNNQDGNMNHWVALLSFDDGQRAFHDPMPAKDGSHLVIPADGTDQMHLFRAYAESHELQVF